MKVVADSATQSQLSMEKIIKLLADGNYPVWIRRNNAICQKSLSTTGESVLSSPVIGTLNNIMYVNQKRSGR